MEWNVVALVAWPGELTEHRRIHPFRIVREHEYPLGHVAKRSERGVDWSSTVRLLERELVELDAETAVLQMAVAEKDIRRDGWIRSNARPEHPGVILSFDSKYGPLSYPCDTFDDWQANVRAIALALEALRKVDRYGVTKTGEQYTGWKRLPGPGQSTVTMTARAAAEIMVTLEARGGDPDDLLASHDAVGYTYRNAAKLAHPDVGGSADVFARLQTAKAVLDRHHTNGGTP